MEQLIDWKVLFEEDMRKPGFKEKFDRGYEEFRKQNAADLAAERAQKYRAITATPPRIATTFNVATQP